MEYGGHQAPQHYAPFAAAPYSPPVKPRENVYAKDRSSFRPDRTFLFVGSFMLAMLVLIPIWNSVALTWDPIFMHMVGASTPTLMVFSCGTVLCVYIATIVLWFRLSSPYWQNERSVLLIASLFLLALGFVLLMLSQPLAHSAAVAYQDLWDNCQFGETTKALADTSQALQVLRAEPGCLEKPSIEECEGFETSPAALVLKALEAHYRCSGFCFQSATPVGRLGSNASLLIGITSTVSSVADPVLPGSIEFVPYPPTLFSKADYEAACDSMAARSMKYSVGDIANQTFYQGIALIIVSITINLMKYASFFLRIKPRGFHDHLHDEHLAHPHSVYRDPSYGATM